MAAGGIRICGREKTREENRDKKTETLRKKLAFYCAPVLMGRKVSNLLIADRELEPYIEEAGASIQDTGKYMTDFPRQEKCF